MAKSTPPLSTPPAEPSEPVEQFNWEIYLLLKLRSSDSRSVLAYTDRLLRQFRLQGRFSGIEIFAIAYLRGIDKLTRTPEDPIRKPALWMRKTILNVIREKSRKSQKETSLVWDIEDESNLQVEDTKIDEDFDAVIEAFSKLSDEDQLIISLRWIKGMSWKAILEVIDEPGLTVPTLRKRGQRAKARLREEYHKIKPPVSEAE